MDSKGEDASSHEVEKVANCSTNGKNPDAETKASKGEDLGSCTNSGENDKEVHDNVALTISSKDNESLAIDGTCSTRGTKFENKLNPTVQKYSEKLSINVKSQSEEKGSVDLAKTSVRQKKICTRLNVKRVGNSKIIPKAAQNQKLNDADNNSGKNQESHVAIPSTSVYEECSGTVKGVGNGRLASGNKYQENIKGGDLPLENSANNISGSKGGTANNEEHNRQHTPSNNSKSLVETTPQGNDVKDCKQAGKCHENIAAGDIKSLGNQILKGDRNPTRVDTSRGETSCDKRSVENMRDNKTQMPAQSTTTKNFSTFSTLSSILRERPVFGNDNARNRFCRFVQGKYSYLASSRYRERVRDRRRRLGESLPLPGSFSANKRSNSPSIACGKRSYSSNSARNFEVARSEKRAFEATGLVVAPPKRICVDKQNGNRQGKKEDADAAHISEFKPGNTGIDTEIVRHPNQLTAKKEDVNDINVDPLVVSDNNDIHDGNVLTVSNDHHVRSKKVFDDNKKDKELVVISDSKCSRSFDNVVSKTPEISNPPPLKKLVNTSFKATGLVVAPPRRKCQANRNAQSTQEIDPNKYIDDIGNAKGKEVSSNTQVSESNACDIDPNILNSPNQLNKVSGVVVPSSEKISECITIKDMDRKEIPAGKYSVEQSNLRSSNVMKSDYTNDTSLRRTNTVKGGSDNQCHKGSDSSKVIRSEKEFHEILQASSIVDDAATKNKLEGVGLIVHGSYSWNECKEINNDNNLCNVELDVDLVKESSIQKQNSNVEEYNSSNEYKLNGMKNISSQEEKESWNDYTKDVSQDATASQFGKESEIEDESLVILKTVDERSLKNDDRSLENDHNANTKKLLNVLKTVPVGKKNGNGSGINKNKSIFAKLKNLKTTAKKAFQTFDKANICSSKAETICSNSTSNTYLEGNGNVTQCVLNKNNSAKAQDSILKFAENEKDIPMIPKYFASQKNTIDVKGDFLVKPCVIETAGSKNKWSLPLDGVKCSRASLIDLTEEAGIFKIGGHDAKDYPTCVNKDSAKCSTKIVSAVDLQNNNSCMTVVLDDKEENQLEKEPISAGRVLQSDSAENNQGNELSNLSSLNENQSLVAESSSFNTTGRIEIGLTEQKGGKVEKNLPPDDIMTKHFCKGVAKGDVHNTAFSSPTSTTNDGKSFNCDFLEEKSNLESVTTNETVFSKRNMENCKNSVSTSNRQIELDSIETSTSVLNHGTAVSSKDNLGSEKHSSSNKQIEPDSSLNPNGVISDATKHSSESNLEVASVISNGSGNCMPDGCGNSKSVSSCETKDTDTSKNTELSKDLISTSDEHGKLFTGEISKSVTSQGTTVSSTDNLEKSTCNEHFTPFTGESSKSVSCQGSRVSSNDNLTISMNSDPNGNLHSGSGAATKIKLVFPNDCSGNSCKLDSKTNDSSFDKNTKTTLSEESAVSCIKLPRKNDIIGRDITKNPELVSNNETIISSAKLSKNGDITTYDIAENTASLPSKETLETPVELPKKADISSTSVAMREKEEQLRKATDGLPGQVTTISKPINGREEQLVQTDRWYILDKGVVDDTKSGSVNSCSPKTISVLSKSSSNDTFLENDRKGQDRTELLENCPNSVDAHANVCLNANSIERNTMPVLVTGTGKSTNVSKVCLSQKDLENCQNVAAGRIGSLLRSACNERNPIPVLVGCLGSSENFIHENCQTVFPESIEEPALEYGIDDSAKASGPNQSNLITLSGETATDSEEKRWQVCANINLNVVSASRDNDSLSKPSIEGNVGEKRKRTQQRLTKNRRKKRLRAMKIEEGNLKREKQVRKEMPSISNSARRNSLDKEVIRLGDKCEKRREKDHLDQGTKNHSKKKKKNKVAQVGKDKSKQQLNNAQNSQNKKEVLKGDKLGNGEQKQGKKKKKRRNVNQNQRSEKHSETKDGVYYGTVNSKQGRQHVKGVKNGHKSCAANDDSKVNNKPNSVKNTSTPLKKVAQNSIQGKCIKKLKDENIQKNKHVPQGDMSLKEMQGRVNEDAGMHVQNGTEIDNDDTMSSCKKRLPNKGCKTYRDDVCGKVSLTNVNRQATKEGAVVAAKRKHEDDVADLAKNKQQKCEISSQDKRSNVKNNLRTVKQADGVAISHNERKRRKREKNFLWKNIMAIEEVGSARIIFG